MRINTNISALRAHHSIAKANSKVSTAMQRLSTGYKINSSKDSPSGLAISNKMRNQIDGLGSANRNSMDGISIVQTADGALNEVHAMLQRMRELALQAGTQTLEDEDREKIQLEIEQLMEEINDVAIKAQFNTMKLFAPKYSYRDMSVSPGLANIMTIADSFPAGTLNFEFDQIGQPAKEEFDFSALLGNLQAGDTINLNGTVITFDGTETAAQAVAKIKAEADRQGILSHVNSSGDKITLHAYQISCQSSFNDPAVGHTSTAATNFQISSSDFNTDAVNYSINGNKITFEVDGSKITMEIPIALDTGGNVVLNDGTDITTIIPGNELKLTADLGKHNQYGDLYIQIGANKDMRMVLELPEVTSATLGIDDLNYVDWFDANQSITTCDNAINRVSEIRSVLGAYQNRLEYTVSGLDVTANTMSEALSRIIDTDMAMEMTNYTKESVIMQAAVSILAQANQRPQQVLQLLN